MKEGKLRKSRTAARGWVTRSSNALLAMLNDPSTLTKVELQDAMDDFDRRLATLDNVQSNLELEINDSKDLEEDIEYADKFRREVRAPRIQATQRLVDLSKDESDRSSRPTSSGSVDSSGNVGLHVKLPKLELPKFSGVITEWQSFWDRFVALVDDTDIPVISKFCYLQSLLEGEAKSVIQGLSQTSANYHIACKMLKDRFGKPERIIFAHIQALLNVSMPTKSFNSKHYVTSLWKLQDELLTHVRSLEALGVNGDQYGVFMTPVILSRLPHEIRLEWSREGSGHENDLSWLMSFLQREIERRERSDTFKDISAGPGRVDDCGIEKEKKIRPMHKLQSSASALQTTSEVNIPKHKCSFCDKNHKSENCYAILKLSLGEREEAIRAAGLCFRCLGKGHISRGCKANCIKCKGKHNILCCSGNKPYVSNNQSNPSMNTSSHGIGLSGTGTTVTANTGDNNENVTHVGVAHCKPKNNAKVFLSQTCSVLQTAKVKVLGTKGMFEATVLFDNGSDRSYVSKKFVKRVSPKWVSNEYISYSSFGDSKASPGNPCNMYDLSLIDLKGECHSLLASEIPDICAPLFRPSVPDKIIREFSYLPLADNYMNNRHVTVDILVGLNAYWNFVMPNKVVKFGNLVAHESVFGWVLSGSYNALTKDNVNSQLLCINDVSEYALNNFWDLESVGICTKEAVCNDIGTGTVLKEFSNTVKFDNGRYEVALPWKSDAAKQRLQNNEKLARKRLQNLNVKLDKIPNLRERYDEVFKEYERNCIIEEVPPSELVSLYPVYYLPHRPVVRDSSSSTKVRPVFDASAIGYNGISLNDCLECGPSLNPDLVEVLLRFRKWKVALTADITKAFLQIKVKREDQDVHRFLWQTENIIRIMRFVRVPFGNKSSPFLLNAVIKHHLSKYSPSEVLEELRNNLYVDDWLSGADSVVEAFEKFNEASKIMADAGMSLAKWNSNNKGLKLTFNGDCECYGEDESVKILGMQWLSAQDYFKFNDVNVGFQYEVMSTKRNVLSLIARCFDPLGFISPFIMFAKILFQDVWRLGLKWDDVLPEELHVQFQDWVKGFKHLCSMKIQRCYFPDLSWKDLQGLELHSFGDASEKGYGACIYMRMPLKDGHFQVSLVMSRGKVAPIKKISLPRLELLGALLCARLLVFVSSALSLSKDVSYYCWTDSTVALSWIKGDPCRWKTFVANRVSEIQTLTPPNCWYHCPGKSNPADLISRGVSAKSLVTSDLWLFGPPWLKDPLSFQHEKETIPLEGEECDETPVVCIAAEPFPQVFEFSRWSRFPLTLNIVAWTLRFINNCKPHSVKYSGPLSYSELSKAKTKFYFCVQREAFPYEIRALDQGKQLNKGSPLSKLDPFLDNDGLLRIKGRLEYSDLSYESKHPIILPSTHIVKVLVHFQHRFLKHAGVSTLVSTLRNCYWIVQLRKIAKAVCRECVHCRRQDSKACSQPVAPLPELRVKSAPPFTVTGLDYAGPLFCVDIPDKKLYILLFTCAVVRSVHLELTDSLNVHDCLLALRRFTARRGMPSVFYSDNAKTFVSASHLLQQHYGPLAPQWKFIVPRAPWWGGWWERLIRSVKSALKRTLGIKCLTRSELETTLHEVEACINSRPLTFLGEDPDIANPLTPSHFLIGRTAGFQIENISEHPSCVSSRDLCEREYARQRQLEKFWEIWSTDYIRNLPCTVKGFVSKCNLKEGSVVLVSEDNVSKLSWPLGVVIKLFPGKDGLIRSVDVKTSKGVINRPVQRLHDLEISSASDLISEENVPCIVSEGNDEFVSDSFTISSYVDVNKDKSNISQPTNEPMLSYTRSGRAVKAPLKLNL